MKQTYTTGMIFDSISDCGERRVGDLIFLDFLNERERYRSVTFGI